MPGIHLLTNEKFSYEFEKDDVKIIDEMIGKFGTKSREEVVLKALSLLYTIQTECPNAKTVVVQDEKEKVTIPLS